MTDENGTFPDFLGIGAPKAGSTWLWTNLKKHPQIWMPPRKEMHYFNRSPDYPSKDFLSEDHFLQRVLGRKHHNVLFRRQLARQLHRNLRNPSWANLSWDARFLLGTYNDHWYSTLFAQGKGKVKGEISTTYMILNQKDVEHIRQLMPKVKIIFMMRNPIDRTWSRIRKRADNSNEAIDSLPMETMLRWANATPNRTRGDYVKTLSTWGSCFPKEQFFVGFYEEVKETPQDFLLRLLEFLGVEASRKHIPGARSRINASSRAVMPEELKAYLAEQHHEQLKYLSATVGSYAEKWLEEAETILQNAKTPLVTAG